MSGNLFHIYHEHSQIPILVTKPVNSDDSLIPEAEINAFVGTVISSLPVSDMKLTEIIEPQEDDEVCKRVKQYCVEGWPEKHAVADAVTPYWRERGELTVVQNLIMEGMRILIPSNLQLEVLDKIHQGHLELSPFGSNCLTSFTEKLPGGGRTRLKFTGIF